MAAVLAFLTAHGVAILTALVTVASLITGMTNTPKDDSVVATIRNFLSRFGLLTYADAPGSVKLPLREGTDPLMRPRG